MMVGAGMFSPARAQMIPDNAVFYHAIRSPWSNSYNPALFPKNSSWYVTTAKTSLQLSIPLSYNDLGLQIDPVRNVTVLNVNDLLDRLRSTGCNFYNNSDLNLFGFGFTLLEHVHVSASAGVKSLSSFNIPLGLIDFLTQGNLNETGHIDFGEKDIFSNQNFAYVSLGAAVKLPFIPLTLGARVNVLDGIAALSVDNLSLDLTTAEDVSSIRLTSDYMIHSAGGFKFKRTEGGSFAFDMEHLKDFVPLNIGFTVDLGAKYNVGVFDFSVSLLDVGPGIKWKQSPTVYFPKQKDVSISFEGIDLSTLVTNGTVDTSFIGRLKDSLLAMIDYSQEESEYWHSIPTRLYAGVSASLGQFLRVGYLLQGQFYNGIFNSHHSEKSHHAFNNTLSAHINLFNWLELSVANSFSSDGRGIKYIEWFNPGIALTFSPGRRMQFFAALEYLSSTHLRELKSAHFMFGINVVGLRN